MNLDEYMKTGLAALTGMTQEEIDGLDQWYAEHKHEVVQDERYEATR